MLEKVKVNYSHVTILQAYEPNEKLEIGIKRDEVTIASIDAINV